MHYVKFPRVFVIVCDSLGIGCAPDAATYDDEGTDTLGHCAQACGSLRIPMLNSMGMGDINAFNGSAICSHPHAYSARLQEASKSKDTLTGHWEMMGIVTEEPFKLFTHTGFPQELKDAFEKEVGVPVKWLATYSGTQAIHDFGEWSVENKGLIVYTSGDSVFQIAAHEDIFPTERLYEICAIARKLCDLPQYHIGRVIARPFVGKNADDFHRVMADRRDLSHTPTKHTYMSLLKDAGYTTYCVGKTCDIFSMVGVTGGEHTESNADGMLKTIAQVKDGEWGGMCFTNLVAFDSEYGHRRDPVGYGKCLEEFDSYLYQLVLALHQDDLLIITGDHGNDPTYKGTDHTREYVPFLAYSKSFKNGRKLPDRATFADLGKTIALNFGLSDVDDLAGTPIVELLEVDA